MNEVKFPLCGVSKLTGELFLSSTALEVAGISFDYARPLEWDNALREQHGGLDPIGFVTMYAGGDIASRMYPCTREAVKVYDILKAVGSALV